MHVLEGSHQRSWTHRQAASQHTQTYFVSHSSWYDTYNTDIAQHTSLAARVSAHYVQNCADDIRLYPWPISSVLLWHLSVHRSSPFPFIPGFMLLTMMTWLYHVVGPCVMVHAVSALWHSRFGTCCHLISRTVMLVANSSSRASRLGSLCKPTDKRRLWELCLSSALQILDLIRWLMSSQT